MIFGNKKQQLLLGAYINGTVHADAALIVGPSGYSKTTLALSTPLRSQEIYGDEIRTIHKKRLLIVNDADLASEKTLLKFLSLPQKKILITTKKLPMKVVKRCHVIKMDPPTQKDYTDFLVFHNKIGDTRKFRSWWDCINFVAGGSPTSSYPMTEQEQAVAFFSKERLPPEQKLTITNYRLLEYYEYNGGNPLLATHLMELEMKSAFQKKVARDLLEGEEIEEISKPWRCWSKNSSLDEVQIKLFGFF